MQITPLVRKASLAGLLLVGLAFAGADWAVGNTAAAIFEAAAAIVGTTVAAFIKPSQPDDVQ